MRLSFLLLLLTTLAGNAQFGAPTDTAFWREPAATTTYLVSQGFEGTGYDRGETWTENISGSSIVDEDYTDTVLSGSQSLRITNAAALGYTYTAFTAQSEVWGYFLLRPVTISGGAFPNQIMTFSDGGAEGNSRLLLRVSATGKLGISASATEVLTTDSVVVGTTYHVWVYYKKGTGITAIARVGFSTDGVRPTSGNKFAEVTNGTSTTDVNLIVFGQAGAVTEQYIFDKVRVDNELVGDNPP